MKKATGTVLVMMLLLCIVSVGILGFLVIKKNSEIKDLNSDLQRRNESIEEYKGQVKDLEYGMKRIQDDLEDKNSKLQTEVDGLHAQLDAARGELQDQQAKIPTADSVVFNENETRIYQQGEYGDFCNKNDTYDTLQYTFSTMYNDQTDVVFAGDSLVERGAWAEIYPDLKVKNRGIGGDSINGLRVRIDTIMLTKPKKLFIYVGINDVLQGREVENILGRYNELFDELGRYDCQIYVQSIMPVSASQYDAERICLDVNEINERLRNMVTDRGFTFIDLWSEFAGEDWALRDEFYYDGVHVNATAYKHWKEVLDPYVYGE